MSEKFCRTCDHWACSSDIEWGFCVYLEKTLPFWAEIPIEGKDFPSQRMMTRDTNGFSCPTWTGGDRL